MRERLESAREAGVAGVGLFMADLEHWAAEGMTDRDLESMLTEHGLLFVDLDLINLAPRDPDLAERTRRFVARAVELADRFGYRYLQTLSPNAEPDAAGFDEVVDALGQVADAVAPYGVEVGLEYTGFTTVKTATEALAVVAAVGRPHVGICVDVWHHRRVSGAVPVASIPGAAVRCVQLDDGPLAPVEPDYKIDCVRNRWAPGTGEMDVAGLVGDLIDNGVDVPWTVEVCRGDDELTEGRGRAHVLESVAATRALLEVVAAARRP
jgi:sugar phosphate isomerase/epimerase